MWNVEVVSHESGKVVKTVPAGDNQRRAEKVMDGMDINLDHGRFFTRLSPPVSAGLEAFVSKAQL